MYPNSSQQQMVLPQQGSSSSIEMVSVKNEQGPPPQVQQAQTSSRTPQGLTAFAQALQHKQSQVQGAGVYSTPSKCITAIRLRQSSWVKAGCAVSYTGTVKFQADSLLTKGCIRAMKEHRTGEGMNLMKAIPKQNECVLYVADEGKSMVNVALNPGESVIVKGEDVVAFEESVQWKIEELKGGLGSLIRGAKYFIKLTGPGNICIGCHGDPIVLPVTANCPIRADPDNTVMWTKNTVPSTKHSVNKFLRMFGLYRSTGEEKQWQFSGEGFIVLQPVEESTNRQRTKRVTFF